MTRSSLAAVGLAGTLGLTACGAPVPSAAPGTLVVAGYGGSYEEAFKQSVIPGFEKTCGCKVSYIAGSSTDTVANLKAQQNAPQIDVALIDDGPQAQAVRAGLLASSAFTLLLAHLVLTVPYTVRLVLAGLAGLDRSAEKAAAGLGAAPFLVFWHVTLPAVRGALIGGAFFAFITSFDDLTVALFVVTTDLQTLPVRIFNYMQYDYDPTVTAIGTLMVLFAAVAVVVIERFVGVARLFGADAEQNR
ncbi:ABC transporter permease subunit [Nonomuraea sp. NPDC049269]|uniref:ABC transporter permease subunit n=1 Tax=Nonomuraea sp. NPDC049269 TaxID=3364349 RepID=UPI00371CD39F